MREREKRREVSSLYARDVTCAIVNRALNCSCELKLLDSSVCAVSRVGRVTGSNRGNNVVSRDRRNVSQQRGLGGREPQLCPRPSLRIRFCTPRRVCVRARKVSTIYAARARVRRAYVARRLNFSETYAASFRASYPAQRNVNRTFS